ncbi:hypothetical protein [Salininema proteolyticum]|uniref:Secreted protein n=1 Tax=Salininema proteolyticum TaxID=1607685 RepID=A0ABV8TX01_9ACTN
MKRKLLTTLAAAGLMTLASAGPAAAATGDFSPSKGDHCVTNLDTLETNCYETFTESIAEATGGIVTDAPSDPLDAVESKAFADSVNYGMDATQSSVEPKADAYLLSVEYEHRYRGGNGGKTWAHYGTRPCLVDGKRDYQINDIRTQVDPWWNDRISSFQGYHTCDVNHYQHSHQEGSSTGPKKSMDDMGYMNDRTTSLTWG